MGSSQWHPAPISSDVSVCDTLSRMCAWLVGFRPFLVPYIWKNRTWGSLAGRIPRVECPPHGTFTVSITLFWPTRLACGSHGLCWSVRPSIRAVPEECWSPLKQRNPLPDGLPLSSHSQVAWTWLSRDPQRLKSAVLTTKMGHARWPTCPPCRATTAFWSSTMTNTSPAAPSQPKSQVESPGFLLQ